MKNTILSRPASRTPSKRKSALRSSVQLETLEIRNLLAANTLAFVDNLSIDEEGATRDLQLDITTSTSTLIGVRIAGTSGNLDPDAAKIFNRDSETGDITTQITPYSSNKDVGGKTDSLVYFQVSGSQQFTIQVGGESGTGDFIAEVFLFGDATGNGGVSEHEYMRAVAAELQGRGAGNHNTAMYFQTMWGIDFNKSQFNAAFDANADGKVSGTELGMMQANYEATLANGNNPIEIELVGDAEGPIVQGGVAVDTGEFDDDNITNEFEDVDGKAFIGQITDVSAITSATVIINGDIDSEIDLFEYDSEWITWNESKTEINFAFSLDDLELMLGSEVVNTGPHTLTFFTVDELGNTNGENGFDIAFNFDESAPDVTAFFLDPDSDTGISDDDGITSNTVPTFIVEAEAGSKVEFYSGATLIGKGVESEDTPGLFTFTWDNEIGGQGAEGSHTITVEVTDLAGNVTDDTPPVVIRIDTTAPDVPGALTLANPTFGDNVTDQATADFSGTVDLDGEWAGSVIAIVLEIDGATFETTADSTTGAFSFSDIPLGLGENELVFIAEDLAGNTSQASLVVVRNTQPTIDDQTLSIPENPGDGDVVGTVIATDVDAGDTLKYSIVGVTAGYDDAFVIDSDTGVITVADPSLFDHETREQIILTVQVMDSLGDGADGDGLVNTATITIDVLDVNEAPSIEGQVIENILENTTDPELTNYDVGDVIGDKIWIDDPDVPAVPGDYDFTFNIVSGNTDGAFEIVTGYDAVEQKSYGEIKVLNPSALNFEANPVFNLVVTVADDGGPDGAGNELTSEQVTVTIHLRDVVESVVDGDAFELSENPMGADPIVIVGHEVGRIIPAAEDTDFDYSDYSFEIISVNGVTTDLPFAIDENGVITVTNADPSVLDYETTPDNRFRLVIQVTDPVAGGISPYTIDVMINLLDENDAPTVNQSGPNGLDDLELNIDENPEEEGDELNTVIDLDDYFNDVDDPTLTYEIVGGNTGDAFKIDEHNNIVVNNPAAVDYEAFVDENGEPNGLVILTIRATDGGGLTVDGTITIQINDVNELPVGDGDNVVLDQTVLWIHVNDPSQVYDEDDPDSEDAFRLPIGLVDPEGDGLTYEFVLTGEEPSEAAEEFFKIEDGNIVLIKELTEEDLGPDGRRQFTLTFDLKDDNTDLEPHELEALGVTVTFVVAINQAPEFVTPPTPVESAELEWSEHVPGGEEAIEAGTIITEVLAEDEDGDTITYSVVLNAANDDENLEGIFGVFTAEEMEDLFGVITDGDPGASYLVILDPERFRFNFINEHIDGDDGRIDLDLIASDGIDTTVRTITITVLDVDEPPVFTAPTDPVTVDESVLHADGYVGDDDFAFDLNSVFSDPDNDELTFEIVATFATGVGEGNALDGAFVIVDGVLIVNDPSLIDYESLEDSGVTSITVTISAFDGEFTVTGDIVIDVNDVNELPTVVEGIPSVNIPLSAVENYVVSDPVVPVPVPDAVININDVLTDDDPEEDTITFDDVTGEEASGYGIFEIGPNGQIYQIGEVVLQDGISETFELWFHIQDDNDNPLNSAALGFEPFKLTIVVTANLPPEIEATGPISVPENAANGTPVHTVVATDPDGDDEDLVYAIDSYSVVEAEGVFEIDPVTGVITVLDNTKLDYSALETFEFTVSVTDSLGEGSTSTQVIEVAVLEVTNEAPELIEGASVDPIFADEGLVEWDGENDYYTLRFSGDFRDQFFDVEDDTLELRIANLDDLVATTDYIHSIEYDNDMDELVITFFHYTASQDRSAVEIEIVANDGTSDSAENLVVELSVSSQTTAELHLIPLLTPTSGDILSLDPNNLPDGVQHLAREQSFFVEIWVSGDTITAMGRASSNGLQGIDLMDMNFNNSAFTVVGFHANPSLSIPRSNSIVIDPDDPNAPEWQSSIVIDNASGTIDGFFALYEPGIADGQISPDGNFTRLGFVEFVVNAGADLGEINDVLSVDIDAGRFGIIHYVSQPTLPGGAGLQADVDLSQIHINQGNIEILDAIKFTINQEISTATILTGSGKINGGEITGQGGDGVGNVTKVSGDIYIVFDDPDNPTSMTIISAQLNFENSGEYSPGAPATPGGNPVIGIETPGNIGLSGEASGGISTDVAFREMQIRLGASDESISIEGDGTFDSSSLELSLGGFADIFIFGSSGFKSQRHDLNGFELEEAGAEAFSLIGGAGAFTLTLDLNRVFLDTVFNVSGNNISFDLLLNATIVATVGGGAAPLMGTAVGNTNQPLESGSGVFVTVVKNPTQVDPNSQLTELPDSLTWTDEWGSVWVEVWGNTADAAGIYGGYVDIAYNSDVYTATEFQYASNFNLERAGSVDDAAGMIYGLGSRSETLDQGNGGFVLLGRVKLESLAGDGIEVGVDMDFKPESLGLEVTSAQLDYTGVGTLNTPVAHVPNVEVWGVAYDVDNDGRIGLSDFTKFISVYGSNTLTSDNALAAAFDFNNDGRVGLADFTYFIQNYGVTKGGDRDVIFPTNFAQTWVGQQIQLDGPDSLQQVFDAAVQDWQDAIGWDHAIDVQLVVSDLPGSQLGEAQLVQLDADGLPAKGIVTIDNDGAGVGWSSDLVGGPAEGRYDLYTVILHELGHVYGFMQQYSGFGANIVTDAFGDKVYYGSTFTAKLDAAGQHLDDVDHAGDVMNATLDPGVRKTISDLNVQMLLAAYENASGATFNSTTAALHAMSIPTVGNGESDAISATTLATAVSPTGPNASEFVMGEIAELTSVSGRTGTAVVMPEMLSSKLQQNGLRVHTRSTFQSVNLRDDIDSAVAELDFSEVSGLLGITEDSTEFEVARTADADEDLDDLFATWGEDQV